MPASDVQRLTAMAHDIADDLGRPAVREDAVAAAREVERRYYWAMTVPFAIDLVITLIIGWIIDLPGLLVRNLASGAVFLLIGAHFGARGLFRPIRQFLRSEIGFAAIERPLTQLPLRSATVVAAVYLPALP